MDVLLDPGKYVLAVSGGVDSIVLLDMLSHDKNLDLVVAHFDHGIRDNSADDAKFVEELASKYGLKFFAEHGELGPDASEAHARKHRYAFLDRVAELTGYRAIVTAHHQDDLIETALLNILRGTKRKGLVSLKSTEHIKRPLLQYSKDDLLKYAQDHGLQWREDSTNQDLKYKRNEVRKYIKESLSPELRLKIIEILNKVENDDQQIEEITQQYLNTQKANVLDKIIVTEQPVEVAAEIVAAWLRKNDVGFNKNTILRIIKGAKELRNGSQIDVMDDYFCELSKSQITLKRRWSV